MLEAGSNPLARTKGGLTALQLVDPRNGPLRDLIRQHEYLTLNAGDFVSVEGNGDRDSTKKEVEEEDDAEFSGSDEEERAEWERRRKEKGRA